MADQAATPDASTPQAPDDGTSRPDLLISAATAVIAPFTVARQLLPDNPVPVALAAGALATAGVIEWPVAVAVGLGYAALRRWNRPAPTPRGGVPPA